MAKWLPQSKVAFATWSLIVLVLLGTVGFRLIEGWHWFDCFYFTIITLATIGYKEPDAFSDAGRYFTAFLIVSGVGTVGYALSQLTQAAIQGELIQSWEKRRLCERLAKISDHFIICGAGRVGVRVAKGLAAEEVEFVLIENDREKVEFYGRRWLVVSGDAMREDVLREAGVARARGLVCALPTDADNVFIVLTARDLCETLHIVARVNDESTIPKMRKAGADKIISPLLTGAHQIVQSLLRPTVAQFFELTTQTEGLDLIIEEVHVSPGSVLANKTLRESNLRRVLEVIIVAIANESGVMQFNPTANTKVLPGDRIIALGNRSSVIRLAELAGPVQ